MTNKQNITEIIEKTQIAAKKNFSPIFSDSLKEQKKRPHMIATLNKIHSNNFGLK
jgi:hypothetical protein